MTDREKELIKYKNQYMNLVNKITQLQISGENPPEKLLKKAQEKLYHKRLKLYQYQSLLEPWLTGQWMLSSIHQMVDLQA